MFVAAPYEGAEKETADMHTILDASYSEHALILAITQEHLRPNLVGYENKGVPLSFLMLIRKCWAADPASRPSADEVCTAIADILKARGIDPEHVERTRFVAELNGGFQNGVDEMDVDGDVDMEGDDRGTGNGDEMDTNGDRNTVHRADDVAAVSVALEGSGEDGAALKVNPFLACGAFAVSGMMMCMLVIATARRLVDIDLLVYI